MSDSTPERNVADELLLESLCKQARVLATGLPGALSRLTVTAGAHRVDLEWQALSDLPQALSTGGAAAAATQAADADTVHVSGHAVLAPLVGTFYRAAEPGAEPFVNEGDIVEPGNELAIVEAMKIMNRVEAERGGRVVKILPADGEMVEFGQELMIIEPLDPE